ncbi:MAG TPA: DUF2752 domain-containing protein [Propionibacteriaceae bacterium]|nr:DUF2752 domain-containing protein [Propionibacteriaceae bacterium]
MTPTSQVGSFSPSRSLVVLGGFLAYGVSLSALYAATGRGLPCPFRAFTGWDCPLCGGTRLGAALLQRDLAAAFADNPLLLVALLAAAALGVLWAVEVLGGPTVRPPGRVAAALGRVGPLRWLCAALVAATLYTVLRNLL